MKVFIAALLMVSVAAHAMKAGDYEYLTVCWSKERTIHVDSRNCPPGYKHSGTTAK